MLLGYVWQDVNDPYHRESGPSLSTEDCDLIHGSKRLAKLDFSDYAESVDLDWKPKLKLWKITAEVVK